ncbi:hypothetical protein MMC32_008038 [Xylographa parallela]|nr:hypothetical protein [Xylographa parallela]
MKINSFALFALLSLVSTTVARHGNRFGAYDDDSDPLDQKSQVTAFVNTDEGLKVECWEIGDLLPKNQVMRADGSKGTISQKKMAGNIQITLFSFAPSVTIFSFGASEMHSNAVDFRAKPNLFTVKDGLIFIEALPTNADNTAAQDYDPEQFVFADVNGDDWFYFEDSTSSSSSSSLRENCAKPMAETLFNIRTISGSDTTLINFEYDSTPHHRVLHEGRCNFAGLKPVSNRNRFRSQES